MLNRQLFTLSLLTNRHVVKLKLLYSSYPQTTQHFGLIGTRQTVNSLGIGTHRSVTGGSTPPLIFFCSDLSISSPILEIFFIIIDYLIRLVTINYS